MTVLTSAEYLLLETEGQNSNLYLSIYEPELAFIGTISGSVYSQDNQTINFNSTISGSASNIDSYYFQVALVGTTPCDDSLGRTWVRSVSGSTLRFVESDHINWDEASFVTILKYTEIIPVFPRIIQDPADDEDVIFYKIWDIPYTNQNSILGSFINMGSNYAGFLGENGTGTCYWSASGTSNLLDDALTYSWIFEGATITGSNAHTPGNIDYNSTGHHRTILRVTSDSGRVDTSIRYTSFYDRPGTGDNVPIINWELIELGGNRDSLGYTCSVRIRENIPKSKIKDGALVVIFGDDYYGNTQQSVNNNQLGRSGIKFVGYIVGGTIQYDYADGRVEFEAVSPSNFMEYCECFSCSVESKTSPSKWYQVLNMDLQRAIYQYLEWQSSVLLCCDVEFKNFTDRYIQYFDADRASLYDAVNTVMDNARVGRLVSDSLGKLWFEQEVSVIDDAETEFATASTIEKKDWIDEPLIDERQTHEYSYIERGGIQYEPSTNDFAALLSGAPGISPGYRGKADGNQGLALSGQAELNEITGNLYAYFNSRYPNVELKMRANINNVDIAPQEKVFLNIEVDDTPRNIVFTNKAFAIRGKNISWNGEDRRMMTTLYLSEITQGYPGDTIIIPVDIPDEEDVPPDVVPPVPPPPPVIPPVPVSPSGVDAVVIQADDVRTSSNLSVATPDWETKI